MGGNLEMDITTRSQTLDLEAGTRGQVQSTLTTTSGRSSPTLVGSLEDSPGSNSEAEAASRDLEIENRGGQRIERARASGEFEEIDLTSHVR